MLFLPVNNFVLDDNKISNNLEIGIRYKFIKSSRVLGLKLSLVSSLKSLLGLALTLLSVDIIFFVDTSPNIQISGNTL